MVLPDLCQHRAAVHIRVVFSGRWRRRSAGLGLSFLLLLSFGFCSTGLFVTGIATLTFAFSFSSCRTSICAWRLGHAHAVGHPHASLAHHELLHHWVVHAHLPVWI